MKYSKTLQNMDTNYNDYHCRVIDVSVTLEVYSYC